MTTTPLITPYVVDANEVSLAGVRFRTKGMVHRSMASAWAAKITVGDTNRDSDPIRSTLGMADFRGGLGLAVNESAGDVNRVYFSTHDLNRYGHLRHLPRAYGPTHGTDGRPRPASQQIAPMPGEPALAWEYEGSIYVAIGSNIRRYRSGTNDWQSRANLAGTPTDVLKTNLNRRTPVTFTFEGYERRVVQRGRAGLPRWERCTSGSIRSTTDADDTDDHYSHPRLTRRLWGAELPADDGVPIGEWVHASGADRSTKPRWSGTCGTMSLCRSAQ